MDFLKAILGDDLYSQVESKIDYFKLSTHCFTSSSTALPNFFPAAMFNWGYADLRSDILFSIPLPPDVAKSAIFLPEKS